MSWVYLVVAFAWGFALGTLFITSSLSSWKKKQKKKNEEHAALLLELAKKKDDELLASFKKQYQQQVAEYQKKLDELYLKEYLITEGYPNDEQPN